MKNKQIVNKKTKYESTSLLINECIIDKITTDIKTKKIVLIDLDVLKSNIKENIRILEYQIENDCSKNMTLFQTIFCFELLLKYKMCIESIITSPKSMRVYGHNIDIMLKNLEGKNNIEEYDEIYHKIEKMIGNDNKRNLIKYTDFKYNINNDGTIFVNNKLMNNDKTIIKEVIECIKAQII